MADFETPLKRPGLGVLLLNGGSIGLLESGLKVFESGSLTMRLAIVCFGAGAIAGILSLLVEIILPASVPMRGGTGDRPGPPPIEYQLHDLRRWLFWPHWSLSGLFLGSFLALTLSAFVAPTLLAPIGVLLLVGGAGYLIWVAEQLRKRGRRAEEAVFRAGPEALLEYDFDPGELFLHRVLLGIGFGLFALGVVAAVNQPFARAAGDVACEFGYKQDVCKPGRGGSSEGAGATGDFKVPPITTIVDQGPAGPTDKVPPPPPPDRGPPSRPPEPQPAVPTDLLFAYKSAVLEPDAESVLRPIAETIRRGGSNVIVVVTGHTDSIGSEAYNLALSTARARSVAQWLRTDGGLHTVRFDIRGQGEAEPRASNLSEAGRRLNRRVVVERVPQSQL